MNPKKAYVEPTLEQLVRCFIDTVEAAIRNHESRGHGGQQVPYFGDFANTQPSTIIQLRRWG